MQLKIPHMVNHFRQILSALHLMLSKCSLMLAVTRLLNPPSGSLTVIDGLPIRGQAAASQSGVP